MQEGLLFMSFPRQSAVRRRPGVAGKGIHVSSRKTQRSHSCNRPSHGSLLLRKLDPIKREPVPALADTSLPLESVYHFALTSRVFYRSRVQDSSFRKYCIFTSFADGVLQPFISYTPSMALEACSHVILLRFSNLQQNVVR